MHTTATRVHVQLFTGVTLSTPEVTEEESAKLLAYVDAAIRNPQDQPVVAITQAEERTRRLVASRYIVQAWRTSRKVDTTVLDGGHA